MKQKDEYISIVLLAIAVIVIAICFPRLYVFENTSKHTHLTVNSILECVKEYACDTLKIILR